MSPTGYSGGVASRKQLFATLIAAACAFLILAVWALSGQSTGFDLAIRAAVHGFASVPLTHVMAAITTLGSHWTLIPIGAILVLGLAITGRRREAILLPAASLSAELMSILLKLMFHRLRPPVFFGLLPSETYSFPSGHAFVSTVFYGVLAGFILFSGRKGVVVTALIAVPIGLSRVYLGYHYPSDVLGGWVMAVIWLTIVRWIAQDVRQ
jgi:membrane-associated phospholipid phosphatase